MDMDFSEITAAYLVASPLLLSAAFLAWIATRWLDSQVEAWVTARNVHRRP